MKIEKIIQHVERMKKYETRLNQEHKWIESNIVAVAIDIIEYFLKQNIENNKKRP
jgi:hypothetical protein